MLDRICTAGGNAASLGADFHNRGLYHWSIIMTSCGHIIRNMWRGITPERMNRVESACGVRWRSMILCKSYYGDIADISQHWEIWTCLRDIAQGTWRRNIVALGLIFTVYYGSRYSEIVNEIIDQWYQLKFAILWSTNIGYYNQRRNISWKG